jgi:hypothetical protein
MSSYIYAARRTPFGAGGAGQEPAGGVGARSAPPRAPLAPRREARGRDCSCLQCGMSCSDRRFRQFRHRPASPGRRTGRRRHRRRGLPRFMKPGRAALRPAKFESTSPLVARSSHALRADLRCLRAQGDATEQPRSASWPANAQQATDGSRAEASADPSRRLRRANRERQRHRRDTPEASADPGWPRLSLRGFRLCRLRRPSVVAGRTL